MLAVPRPTTRDVSLLHSTGLTSSKPVLPENSGVSWSNPPTQDSSGGVALWGVSTKELSETGHAHFQFVPVNQSHAAQQTEQVWLPLVTEVIALIYIVYCREDMEMCHVILEEMERNRDSWPFLEPVGRNEFPEYFKVIKKPMDFQTMRHKLEDGR